MTELFRSQETSYSKENYCTVFYRNAETDNGVENYLLDALQSLNLINEEEAKYPQLFHYQRASRTDKNVSAARMLVSGELRK